jgi:hypothetical protein
MTTPNHKIFAAKIIYIVSTNDISIKAASDVADCCGVLLLGTVVLAGQRGCEGQLSVIDAEV